MAPNNRPIRSHRNVKNGGTKTNGIGKCIFILKSIVVAVSFASTHKKHDKQLWSKEVLTQLSARWGVEGRRKETLALAAEIALRAYLTFLWIKGHDTCPNVSGGIVVYRTNGLGARHTLGSITRNGIAREKNLWSLWREWSRGVKTLAKQIFEDVLDYPDAKSPSQISPKPRNVDSLQTWALTLPWNRIPVKTPYETFWNRDLMCVQPLSKFAFIFIAARSIWTMWENCRKAKVPHDRTSPNNLCTVPQRSGNYSGTGSASFRWIEVVA